MQTQFAPDGWKYAILTFVAGLLASILSPVAAVVGIVVSTSILAFYRDPDRQIAPIGVASPADGTISVVRNEDGQLRVGVYMSATNVHVTRAPLAGRVNSITHRSGAYRLAFSKDSEHNEQLQIDFGDYSVILIAGWFARRIHPYIEEGDAISKGDRIGHISFGSRADVVLPARFAEEDLAVEAGDPVYAGKTVIAVDPAEEENN